MNTSNISCIPDATPDAMLGVAQTAVLTISEMDPLTEFVIQGRNVSSLKKQANQFIDKINEILPAESCETFTLNQIREAVLHVKAQNDVVTVWGEMDNCSLEGIFYTIKRTDGSYYYIVFLNEKITDLLGDVPETPIKDKCPQNAARARNYFRTLKSVYLHELGHLLLKRRESSLHVESPEQGKSNDEATLNRINRFREIYSATKKYDEDDCNVLSFVLGFWPRKKFTKTVMTMLCNWQKGITGDLRMQVANKFRMPVNATVQWMTILFHDKFGMHYVRREEESHTILDFLDNKSNVLRFYNNDVFSAQGTAAWQAANDGMRADCKKPLTFEKTTQCLCQALYERKEWFFNRSADEIVVVGFDAQQVRDEVDIFTAGSAS